MPTCWRSDSRYVSRTGRMPPGVTTGCCADGPAEVATKTAARTPMIRNVRRMVLPDERELREAHVLVSRPRREECGMARRRGGADLHGVLAVGFDGRAAEEGQPLEGARQRAPRAI